MKNELASKRRITLVMIGMLLIVLFTPGFLSAANVNVTFRVDMAEAYPTTGVSVSYTHLTLPTNREV